MSLEKGPDQDLERRHERRPRRREDSDEFWSDIGVDVDNLSPRAQVTASLAVLIPVAVAAVALFTLAQGFWWLIFVFGWLVFPAFGLLVRGIAGLSEERPSLPSSVSGKERELLEALKEHGELTPARVAMETSLTVAEADGMLKELAAGGHLQVRVRGGGLFYSLWEVEAGRLEDR